MAINTTDITNSATTIYTSSGNSAVTYCTITNVSASAISCDIHVVPSGDSVGNINCVAKTLEIAATDTYQLYAGGEKLLLENSDFISVTANTAAGLHSVVSSTGI
jgi:hypothetical protein